MVIEDYCTKAGANRIKSQIEEYWHKRGYQVDVHLVEAGFASAMRASRTDIRSDMINGMPRRSLNAARSR